MPRKSKISSDKLIIGGCILIIGLLIIVIYINLNKTQSILIKNGKEENNSNKK